MKVLSAFKDFTEIATIPNFEEDIDTLVSSMLSSIAYIENIINLELKKSP